MTRIFQDQKSLDFNMLYTCPETDNPKDNNNDKQYCFVTAIPNTLI